VELASPTRLIFWEQPPQELGSIRWHSLPFYRSNHMIQHEKWYGHHVTIGKGNGRPPGSMRVCGRVRYVRLQHVGKLGS
jgi:hypothetical protein